MADWPPKTLGDHAWHWIAWHLPHTLVTWCLARVAATAAAYNPHTAPEDLTLGQLSTTWADPHHPEPATSPDQAR